MTTALLVAALALVSGIAVWMALRAQAAVVRERDEAGAANAAAASARREAERLLLAMDAVGEGVLVLDEQRRLKAHNAAARDLLGLDARAIGRGIDELLPAPALAAALQRQDGGLAPFELAAGPAGDQVLMVRVLDLGGSGFVVGIDDQSRLRRLESLRRDFVANVSHELKTPLAAILGFVETLQHDPEMPVATRARFLDRVAVQTQRLSTLVRDLLALSRLDNDTGVDAAGEPCDFGAVLRETVRDLLPIADKQHVQLTAMLPGQPMPVVADPEALRQVASNLIDNAIKYTPANGSVRVGLNLADGRVRLEVEDTGIGLSPVDQERVFERFYRVDRARSRELGGTGLGLAIVKNTVKRLGGEVGVRSEPGNGSLFWVELPALAPAGEPPATG